jgi:hypothetical protein
MLLTFPASQPSTTTQDAPNVPLIQSRAVSSMLARKAARARQRRGDNSGRRVEDGQGQKAETLPQTQQWPCPADAADAAATDVAPSAAIATTATTIGLAATTTTAATAFYAADAEALKEAATAAVPAATATAMAAAWQMRTARKKLV